VNRSICISGFPGSGKSTVAYRLGEEFGLSVVSAGSIMREAAAERGMSVTELNLASEGSSELDNLIDSTIKKRASEAACILDSRMAWYFVKDCLKIFLEVSSHEAALRAISRPATSEESYEDVETARLAIESRRISESKRYKKFYSVDIADQSHFDLYIFTDLIAPDCVFEIVLKYLSSEPRDKVQYASPEFLMPTQDIRDVDESSVKACDIENLPTVNVVRVLDRLLIWDDHETVAAAIMNNVPYLQVRVIEIPIGSLTPKEFFETSTSPSRIYDWEDALRFQSSFDYEAFASRLT
jgi:cytidylate kinase